MRKSKNNYINTYKRILVQVLPLSLLLFANCDTKLNLTSIPVDSVSEQSPITYSAEEEKAVSSSGKRKFFVLSNEDKEETGPLLKRINQETYFDQNLEGFGKLPIELQAYILSFLDQQNFHRASLVCQGWREAAFIAGEEKTLDLSGRKLAEKDCQVLLNVPFTSLILKNCRLTEQKILILSQFTRMKHLDLEGNNIIAAGAQSLASGNLAALTSLDLGSNSIGATGAQALASGNLASLTSLDLGYNEIGNLGAQALASGNLGALISLDLNNNGIGDSGAHALASGNLVTLTSLDLNNNSIGDSGVQALASGNLSALTSLYLYNNSIGDSGAQALASGNLAAPTSLNLGYNRIGSAGAQALASGNLSALTSLNLNNNNIGDSGAQALATGNLTALNSIYLGENNIEKKDKKTLRDWAKKKFIKLDL